MSLLTNMLAHAINSIPAEEKKLPLFTLQMRSDIAKIVKRNMVHQSSDLSGWDFDKKMSVLFDMQDGLEEPCYIYKDWGFKEASKFKSVVLSVAEGQEALLDLWTFFMEFCDVVPVRSGVRGMLLRLAGCISRRLEFVDLASVDGCAALRISASVEKRYLTLLQTCTQYCATKLAQSRILSQDHAFFASHIYSVLFYKFPALYSPILSAIQEYTEKLQLITAINHFPSSLTKGDIRNGNTVKSKDDVDSTRLNWICYGDVKVDKFSDADSVKEDAWDAFKLYITKNPPETVPLQQSDCPTRIQNSVYETLQLALHNDPKTCCKEQDEAFISNVPQLFSSLQVEARILREELMDRVVLENSLVPILERLKAPSRESHFVLYFISTMIEDTISWTTKLNVGKKAIRWNCIPGYSIFIEAFVEILCKVCLKRSRQKCKQATVESESQSNISAWYPYWVIHELEPVYDALTDILRNGSLFNAFVQIVIESTNVYDPQSIDYSFNILLQLFEAGAHCNGFNSNPSQTMHLKQNNDRGHLPLSFDLPYFIKQLRIILKSTHFQILLKVLTFIYNIADLLEFKRKRMLVSEVILQQDNFFLLFLHWNEEVRRLFDHILVYKLFVSNRLDLPALSDRVFLGTNPLFKSTGKASCWDDDAEDQPSLQSNSSYYPILSSSLSHLTSALLRPVKEVKKNQPTTTNAFETNESVGKAALERLKKWDTNYTLKQQRLKKQNLLFMDSLIDEEISLDLSISSKLDALMKMIGEQIASQSSECQYFRKCLEVYAPKAISQYMILLHSYYENACDHPLQPPIAPELEFTVLPFFAHE